MSTTVGCYALCIKESSYIMANSTKEDVPGALLNGRKSKTGCQIEIVTGVSLMTRPCELPSNKRVRGWGLSMRCTNQGLIWLQLALTSCNMTQLYS